MIRQSSNARYIRDDNAVNAGLVHNYAVAKAAVATDINVDLAAIGTPAISGTYNVSSDGKAHKQRLKIPHLRPTYSPRGE